MERKDEFSEEYKGENNSGNEMNEKHGEGAKEQNISEDKEEKHVVEVTTETKFENEENYEYKYVERTQENTGTYIGNRMMSIGLTVGPYITLGFPLAGIGYIAKSISSRFAEKYTVRQRKKILIKREYLVEYNLFNDNSKEEKSKTFIKETKEEGDWEDL